MTSGSSSSSTSAIESCGVSDYLFAKGYSGGSISISRNNAQIVRVNGGSGGSYWCSNSNGGCTQNKRFTPTSGSAGSVSYSSSFITPTQRDNYENFGTVKMKWSDTNGFDSFKETTSGCGGDRGDLKSELYPILRSTLPEISIGTGGTNGNAGQKTSFGTIVAKGGTGNFDCNKDASKPDTGGNGVNRVIDTDVTYYGGAAGTKTSRNGGKGSGFGSGGGGAGKSGSSYGTGGAGAPGLLILRW